MLCINATWGQRTAKKGPLHAVAMHARIGNVKQTIHETMYAKGIVMIITTNPVKYVRMGPISTTGNSTIHVKMLRSSSHQEVATVKK